MVQSLRSVVGRLAETGGLTRVAREVDARHMSALLVKAENPLVFERVRGFDFPVVGGLYWTRKRLAAALAWPEADLGLRFPQGIERMLDPVFVDDAPSQQVVRTGNDADLTTLPIPLLGEKDGGPFISAGIVLAHDQELGCVNAGVYRLMYRSPRRTSIDLVTVSDLRRSYERAFKRGEALPITVCIGAHPYQILSAAYKAPPGVSELNIAGGLHGSPLRIARAKTNDVPVLADCEIVLEGEIAPVGWTVDEGPFGDFAGMYTELRWNPVFNINAITCRTDAMLQVIQMPWENAWLGAAATEAQVWEVLKRAGVSVAAVRVTEGSMCRFSVIAAIRKRAGGGKNALMAILSLPDTKHAIVVDEGVDIGDPVQIESALTFRVQADRDVIIVPGAQAKHIDPSVLAWELPKGELPMTAKMGIDATIPERVPPSHYELIRPAFMDEVKLGDII